MANCKKMYDLHDFLGPDFLASGQFSDNIGLFLQQYTDKACKLDGMQVSCTYLEPKNHNFFFPLFIMEEDAQTSETPFCDHCSYTGWSENFVSKQKYHFIIPVEQNEPLAEGVLGLKSHLLHGMIHSNGFGHLIRINGIEGGSKFINGIELMNLWDRICTRLHARKVSLRDVSRKHSVDLRLLYGIAYGNPWFGRWGYNFCCGSYGVKQENYKAATGILGSLDVDNMVDDFTASPACGELLTTVDFFRAFGPLDTLQSLVKAMLTFKPAVVRDLIQSKKRCNKNIRKLEALSDEEIKREAYRKIQFLYEEVLMNTYPLAAEAVKIATSVQILLDSKVFLKEWQCTSKGQEQDTRASPPLKEKGAGWRVECTCGAMDDDGEKMVQCDICSVWEHTLCKGIGDLENVPDNFVCQKCSEI